MLASSTAVRVAAFASVCVVALIVVVSVLAATTHTTTFTASPLTPTGPVPTPTPTIPVPTPTPVEPELPLPSTALWCTYPPDFYLTVNTSCYPISTYNETYCDGMRNVADKACFMAACFAVRGFGVPLGDNIYPWTYEAGRSSMIVLSGSNTSYDSGPIHLLDQFMKLVADNVPDSIDPLEPAPEPYAFGVPQLIFTVANYSDNYQVSSRELLRQQLTLLQGTRMSLAFNASVDVIASQTTIVANARTSRCANPDLAAIEWLTTSVTLGQLVEILRFMPALNVSNSQCDPANWPAECLYWTSGDTHYCSQFGASGAYYTFTSLRNFTELPSPWRDLTTIATALNNEYALCGEPAGCFGMIV